MRKGPTASVRSNLEDQGNVPTSSSANGLSLFEPGLDFELDVWNERMRTEGSVYRISTSESGLDGSRWTGKLADRRGTRADGIGDAIVASAKE